MGMYKSPIEIIQGQLRMEMEGNIIRAVQQQGINVDKHELLRALQYDRGQYKKGYQDGMADANPTWIPVTERLPESQSDVLVVAFWHECWQTMIGWHSDYGQKWRVLTPHGEFEPGGVTHWMPLPEPPKEVE